MTTHSGTRRTAALMTGAVAVALLTAACGSSSSSATTATPGTSSKPAGSSTSDSLAAAKADVAAFSKEVQKYEPVRPLSGVSTLKGKNVWYVPIGSVPILDDFGVGITDALKHAGITTHVCDGKFVPTSMASCLHEAATQGADGVIAGYIDYQLVPTAYDNLVSHHIPVLIAGEAPSGGKTSSPHLAFYDGTASGNRSQELNMEAVMADSGGKAKILYVGVTDSVSTRASGAHAKSFIEKNCPGCTIKKIDYNTSSLNKVASQVSAALISNPDTTYVVDELDSGSPATISGIQTAGFANKVKLASSSGNLDALQRLRSGQLQVVDTGISSVYNGWQYADGLLRMLRGQVPTVTPSVYRVFTRDNVGGLTLTPTAYQTNSWYGSDDYKQTFTSAWGM